MVKKKGLTETFRKATAQLNPRQRQAVEEIEGPMMVVAGPGTGKTQVLTLRIANILLRTDTPAHAILALTFTEAAAREMRERLVKLIGPDGYYVGIGTFHAFGRGVIQEHPDRFALQEDAEPLTDLERIELVAGIIDQHRFKMIKPLNKPHLYVKSLIRTIQDLKREGLNPETFKGFIRQHQGDDSKQIEKLRETAEVFGWYEDQLRKLDRYDFEDMINKVTEAFSQDEDLLRTYQERLHYFLADEYQDTNSAQNQLLFQLAAYWGEEANVFVVGDPDQAIYRFQGASLENALMFKDRYSEAKVVYLQDNYRSQQTILDAAQELIKHNQLRGADLLNQTDKESRLVSRVKYLRQKVKTANFSSALVEYAFVGHQIKQWLDKGVKASEIAVVYRDNRDANEIADVLGRMGIKYNLEGGDNVLTTGDVNKLLTLMRTCLALRNKSEDVDLFTIFNYEFSQVEPLDVLKLSRFASEKQVNFLEAIYDPEIGQTKIKDLDAMVKVVQALTRWGQLDTEISFVELFERLLNDSGLLDWMLKQPDAIRRLNRVNSLFREIKHLNAVDHQLDMAKFLHTIELMQANNLMIAEDDLDIDVDAVRLSTAHKVKGLEFEYVVIVKAYDGKWGNKRVPELIKLPSEILPKSDLAKKEKNEDERRLFFVALTRAKKQCWITWSQEYESKQVVPSMFVEEMPDEDKEVVDTSRFQIQSKRILQDVLVTENHQPPVSKEEKVWLKQMLADFKLNPTALNTYLQCAYKFKLDNLLKTPAAKPPHMAYGTAMHKALERFFGQFRKGGEIPSMNFLLQEFEQALTKEILTESQRTEWQDRGEKALRLYMTYYSDELQPPVMTERFFGGKFHPVFLGDIGLTGKVDKVEVINLKRETQNAKPFVRVVDYKTGKPKSKNVIEGKTKNSDGGYKRQLVFYQLLTELDRTFPYSVQETQLDFLEVNDRGKFKKESFVISQEEVAELKSLIRETMAKIRNLEFPRTTDYSICETCQYKNHCWPEGIPK